MQVDSTTAEAPRWPLAESSPLLAYLRSLLQIRPRGLCTDIDGTISETAPTVAAAVLLPGMRDLLGELTGHFDLVATISGRAVEDQRRMIGVPTVQHVGHHGYEWEEIDTATGERRVTLWPDAEPYLPKVAAALDEIEAELAPRIPGLWMERKGITGGVHWRLALDTEKASRIATPVIERIAAKYGLRAVGSRLAIELYPPVIMNKGDGLRRLVEVYHLKSIIYMGDDVSDVDAFRAIHELRDNGTCEGIGIGVLHANAPRRLTQAADLIIRKTEDTSMFLSLVSSYLSH